MPRVLPCAIAVIAATGSALAPPSLATVGGSSPSVALTRYVRALPLHGMRPVVATDAAGNMVVAGFGGTAAARSGGRTAGVRPDNLYVPGAVSELDAWVAKLNRHGDVLWIRTLGGQWLLHRYRTVT